jgi:hypothetical protein
VEIRWFRAAAQKLVPVKPSFYDERNFADVVKRGIMVHEDGKIGVDLGRDRQEGQIKEENQLRNHQEGMVLLVLEGVWTKPTMKVGERVIVPISRADLGMVGRDLEATTTRPGEGVSCTLGLGANVVVTRGDKWRGEITERWMLGLRCAGVRNTAGGGVAHIIASIAIEMTTSKPPTATLPSVITAKGMCTDPWPV